MPRVLFDYVVSFSNEDPDNPASNLLATDITKRKWLCTKGEATCSVVLQIAKAIKIQSIHIGAHHTALVEVLVGLSEKPNDPFEVLVPSCVFVSATESRRGSGVDRVRTFSGEQLTTSRLKPWDRLRVVCSQPYNRHCQYGLSFVHMFSPEEAAKTRGAGLPFPLALETSDEEDSFLPGELFARHHSSSTGTEAQIRQASSNALKNISDSSAGLSKHQVSPRPTTSRQDFGEGTKDVSAPDKAPPNKHKENRQKRKRDSSDKREEKAIKKNVLNDDISSKRRTSEDDKAILRGVVFALSGYQNPRRALLRDAALSLGARYQPDYSPRCTHLICAFPNTPKLRALRDSGEPCVAVRGDWIDECARSRRRLPWEPYATEPRPPPANRSGSDTEDEIERVRRADGDADDDSDVTLQESPRRLESHLAPDKVLSDCLEGWTCSVCRNLPESRRMLLERYLRALGALVAPEGRAGHVLCQGGHAPDGHPDAVRLRPAWLWAALRLKSAPDPLAYSL